MPVRIAGVVFVLVAFFAVATVTTDHMTYTGEAPVLLHTTTDRVTPKVEQSPTTLFFVGDIMLARGVEVYMGMYGIVYPFQYVEEFIATHDFAIANFEGIVSDPHVLTPSMTFQFSVRKEYLEQLRSVGFDVLSLANNHSSDYGLHALTYTRALCASYELKCGGGPTDIDEYATTVLEHNDRRIGILFLHHTWNAFDLAVATSTLQDLANHSDVQFVYIHWGNEYELTYSSAQEHTAQALIDVGADAVIGHHPHVVQDIDFYNGKPIFYSLGNFIFDQFFSADVQEELGISVEVGETNLVYTLLPFTTRESRIQPRPMARPDADALITRITRNISTQPGVDLTNRTITVPR